MRAEFTKDSAVDVQLRYRGWLLTTLSDWGREELITPVQVGRLASKVRGEMLALEGKIDPVAARSRVASEAAAAEAGTADAAEPVDAVPAASLAAAITLPVAIPSESIAPESVAPESVAPESVAPEPAPAEPPPPLAQPFPLPGPPPVEDRPDTLSVVGGFLRARIGWVVGVVLTVVGSFYLAGTVWEGLSAVWRQVLVAGFLGVYAFAFAQLGHRLGRIPGAETARRWLLGVAVVLAPVHAMSAGGLWSLGGAKGFAAVAATLGGVGALHWWILQRALPFLVDDPRRRRVLAPTFLAISLSVALLPVVGGPVWLAVPAIAGMVGLWASVSRSRGLGWATGGLLAYGVGFHAALAPAGALPDYAPLLGLGALSLLYVDAALGRWRAVHRVQMLSWRGVAAVALAVGSLLALLPRFGPLPTGAGSAVTGILASIFFLGGALAWRRPRMLYVGWFAALVATLALPDLLKAIIAPLAASASESLGYGGEPLPLAWYSLTLLPYLALGRWATAAIRRSDWRQAPELSAVSGRWIAGLSLALLALAHTKTGDLRPALLAMPAHAALWFRDRAVRERFTGALPWAALALWTGDLWMQFLLDSPLGLGLAAGLLLAMPLLGRKAAATLLQPALATGAQRVAFAAAPLLVYVAAGAESWTMALATSVWGLVWWRAEASALPEAVTGAAGGKLIKTIPAIAAGLGALGLFAFSNSMNWSLGAGVAVLVATAVAYAALARRYEGARAQALEVWAHALSAFAVLLSLRLDGLERSLVKLPVGGLITYWMIRAGRRRDRARPWLASVYGTLLIGGVVESVGRRLLNVAPSDGACLVALTLLAFAPAGYQAVTGRMPRWLDRALALPSWGWATLGWFSSTVVLAASGMSETPDVLAGIVLVGATLAASRVLPGLLRPIVEGLAWATALALAAAAVVSAPWALAAVTLGIAGVARLAPTPMRERAALVAGAGSLIAGLALGPLAAGFMPALAAAGVVALRASRGEAGWIEAGAAAAVAAGMLSLGHYGVEAVEAYLGLLLAATAVGAVGQRAAGTWGESLRRFGVGVGLVAAATWGAWALVEVDGYGLDWQPVALIALTALLLDLSRSATDIPGVAARALGPVAAGLSVIALGLPEAMIPWVLLGGVALFQTLRPDERVYSRLLLAASGVWMLAVGMAMTSAETAPLPPVAPGWLAMGLLLVRSGLSRRFAWAGAAVAVAAAGWRMTGDVGSAASWAAPALALLAALAATERWNKLWVGTAVTALLLLGGGALWLPAGAVYGLLVLGCFGALAALRGGYLMVIDPDGAPPHEPAARSIAAGAGLVALALTVAALFGAGFYAPPLVLVLAAPAIVARGLKIDWLWLLSLPAIAWVPVEALGYGPLEAWPAALALLSLPLSLLDREDALNQLGARVCLGLAVVTSGLALVETDLMLTGTHAGLIALGFLARRKGSPALGFAWLSFNALWLNYVDTANLHEVEWAWVAMPMTLATAALARGLSYRWLSRGLRLVLLPVALLFALLGPVPAPALLTLAAGLAFEVWATWRQESPRRWWWTLAWGGFTMAAVFVHVAPPDELWLPVLVGFGVLIELVRVPVVKLRSEAFAAPLGQATALLAASGVAIGAVVGGLTAGGFAFAGSLFALRYTLRGGRRELLAAVALLDASVILLGLDKGWSEPLAYVGPLALSALAAARLLRGTTDARVIAATRYLAATALYMTAFAQVVVDPMRTLTMLLLALIGIAAGSWLRVRAYLYLGVGFAAATLVTNLVRFGFEHSQFWALYLTLIGLSVLGMMIVSTVHRERIVAARVRFRAVVGEWE